MAASSATGHMTATRSTRTSSRTSASSRSRPTAQSDAVPAHRTAANSGVTASGGRSNDSSLGCSGSAASPPAGRLSAENLLGFVQLGCLSILLRRL